jgi:hypothetical protein
MRPWPWLSCLALSCVLLTGCQRLKDTKSFTLEPRAVQPFEIPVQKSDLKLTATGTASTPVSCCAVLAEEQGRAERDMLTGKEPRNVLAYQANATEIKLEATIPAGKEAVLLVTSDKKAADVKLTLLGH